VFLLAFAAPGLLAIWDSPASRALYKARGRLLLLFVTLHTIHLGFIVLFARAMGREFYAPSHLPGLVAGGIVYLVIYGLAIATLDTQRRIPVVRSSSFQSAALYVVWIAFALAFTASVVPYPALAPLVAATYTALILRIVSYRRTRLTRAVSS